MIYVLTDAYKESKICNDENQLSINKYNVEKLF